MSPDEFVSAYEQALATQDWKVVEPLVHPDACVTFSNGTVHKRREAIQLAYESNFAKIENEQYRVSNVDWVRRGKEYAAYLFDFDWSGVVDGEPARGRGRGSTVLVREGENWQLLIEHLCAN